MCGIAAIIGKGGALSLRTKLMRALQSIAHRGDARFRNEVGGTEFSALGCNRLPFTSGEQAQPIESPSGRYLIVLNGELYDFHPARSPGTTRSDTEAFAVALDEQGLGCVARLDGMFAAIIVDRFEQRVYLVRDRVGIKPLYYGRDEGRIFVASEIKAIAQFDSLTAIRHVKPGFIYDIDPVSLRLSERRYADLNIPKNEIVDEPTDDLVEALHHAIADSVRSQTSDQDRYGLFLSGGVDSAGIYAHMREMGRYVTPLVIGNAQSDDRLYARQLSELYNEKTILVCCPSEHALFSNVHKVIQRVESFEPNVVRQAAVSDVLSAMATSLGIKAILCGEGADELFGGYPEMGGPDFPARREAFLRDLHRTQLQRVDRTSMHYTTEVRVPYLSNSVIELAMSSKALQLHQSLVTDGEGDSKPLLRAALSKILPDHYVGRPKVVLSEGAGLGGNDPSSGLFADEFRKPRYKSLLKEVRKNFPDWPINSAEEAFYFSIFADFGYHKYTEARDRVTANQIHTRGAVGGKKLLT